jgi:hypothetical protein
LSKFYFFNLVFNKNCIHFIFIEFYIIFSEEVNPKPMSYKPRLQLQRLIIYKKNFKYKLIDINKFFFKYKIKKYLIFTRQKLGQVSLFSVLSCPEGTEIFKLLSCPRDRKYLTFLVLVIQDRYCRSLVGTHKFERINN